MEFTHPYDIINTTLYSKLY